MDPITAAATLTPLVIGAIRRPKKGPNKYGIINRYRASQPAGYITPEDQAQADRTQTRLSRTATAAATRRRAENVAQVTQRGIGGPAAAALEQQASDQEASGDEEAARTSADELYKAFQSNLGYARQQNDTAFGAELGAATHDQNVADAQNSSFWNSVVETIPGIASAWAPKVTSNVVSTAPSATSTAAPSTAYAPQTTVAPTTPAQKSVRGLAGAVYR